LISVPDHFAEQDPITAEPLFRNKLVQQVNNNESLNEAKAADMDLRQAGFLLKYLSPIVGAHPSRKRRPGVATHEAVV
jgi:hypothetical protein